MRTPIALIHASPAAIAPLVDHYTQAAPELDLTNLLDDGILRLFRAGRMDDAIARLEAMISRIPGAARATLEADYRFVQAGDQLSLIFCNGWRTPFPRRGGRMIFTGDSLELSPDPFEGTRIPMRVDARRLPGRRYASAADLRAAFDAAAVVAVEGETAGKA